MLKMNPAMRYAEAHRQHVALITETLDVDPMRIHPDGFHNKIYPQFSVITRRNKHFQCYVKNERLYQTSDAFGKFTNAASAAHFVEVTAKAFENDFVGSMRTIVEAGCITYDQIFELQNRGFFSDKVKALVEML